jgi:DNA-binding protein YbaB
MHDDVQRVMREAEADRRAARASVARLFEEMARRHTTGEAADGTVAARVDGCGRVLSIDIRPDARELSTSDLSARVLEALSAAQDIAQRGQKEFLARRWAAENRS